MTISFSDRRSGLPGHWDGKSIVGAGPIVLGATVVRLIGFRAVHMLSYPIAFLILLWNHRSRTNALKYWRCIRPQDDHLTQLTRVWKHFACFGRLLCDRVLVAAKSEQISLSAQGKEGLFQAIHRSRGCIILSAHVGNWAVAGRIIGKWGGPPIHIVKVNLESSAERRIYESLMGERSPHVIDPRDPIAAIMKIGEVLERGEAVGMLGDRVYGQQPSCTVSFFGRPTKLPSGPFQLASSSKVPIFVCFCLRTGDGSYRFMVDKPWFVRLPENRALRRIALEQSVQRWATRLERQVRCTPLQWHNFHDVWA